MCGIDWLMPIFAVLGLKDPAKLGSKVEERFPNDHFAVAPDKWLVAVPGRDRISRRCDAGHDKR
jgi:hypothetical protein